MTAALLLVEDDDVARRALTRVLASKGFSVLAAGSLAEARKVVASGEPVGAVVLDLQLPDGEGIPFLPELRESLPDAAIVVLTGYGDVPSCALAMREGADHFLLKPAGADEILLVLRKSLETRTLRKRDLRRERLATPLRPFWGTTSAMVALRETAARASSGDSPLLLLGETGTGKGILARWLHERSPRARSEFVEINCSALRGDLLASELFGHVRGAFTSAVDHRQGLLEVADGGTLFLDEIGDMDPLVQAQFLKVLEEKRYRRLGESKERRSDFRLIAATNRPLAEDAASGRFRADLYYRLAVFPLELPPLRSRISDLAALTRHLLGDLGEPDRVVTAAAEARLLGYDWPGNVRELRNVLERARLLAGAHPIDVAHLPGLPVESRRPASPPKPATAAPELTPERIAAALRMAGGNKVEAARLLGISRATLYRRLA